MRIKEFIIALLISIYLTRLANADFFLYPTKNVRTAIFCSKEVDCPKALDAFEISRKYILEAVNVNLDLVLVEYIDHEMSGSPEEQMEKWKLVTKASRKEFSTGATIIMTSAYASSLPVVDYNSEQVLGLASGIGNLGDIDSVTYVKLVGNIVVSSRIITHEVGHLAGGSHIMGGILHPSAQAAQCSDKYLPETIEQIKSYVSTLP